MKNIFPAVNCIIKTTLLSAFCVIAIVPAYAQKIGITNTATFTPNYLLHIHDNVATTGTLMQLTNSNSGSLITDGFKINLSTGKIEFVNQENAAISFFTSNSERMYIDATGNVGIGTTIPGNKLDVNGVIRASGNYYNVVSWNYNGTPTNGVKIKTNIPYTDGSQMPTIILDGYDYGSGNPLGISLVWYVYGGNFVNYKASSWGNITPVIKLANEGGKVTIHLAWTPYYGRLTVRTYAQGMSEDPSWFNNWTVADETAGVTNQVTVSYSNTFPGTVNFAGGIWNSSGNVGIGTTNPAKKLDVTGDINFTGALYANGSAGASGQLLYSNAGATNGWLGVGTSGQILISTGGIPGWNTLASINGVTTSCGTTNYVPKMSGTTTLSCSQIYDNATNVGIGTTSPGKKLEVNGDIKLSSAGYQIYLGENVTTSAKIGINFHTDSDPNYWIGKPAGAWTQPLHIGFYTGIKIGANSGYGGTKFYNSSDMGTEIMSIGNGDNHVRVLNNLYASIMYDWNDASYYSDPNGTSELNQLTTSTRARWRMPRWWTNRTTYTADQNYWTGTNGWGTSEGTWADAWKGGFSGWDIWGTSTDHPQGSGYVHAQGIVAGEHYATTDGSQAYGWMMVGAANATDNRYWLRGKWGGTTSAWTEMITTSNIGSYGDNLGNHTATTTLNMNTNNISNVGDIYATQNYGLGLVGVYSDTRYQNVWAMGTSWRLAADGTTPGNLYGLAWTHSNIGGQSKAGLSHQLLVMENGVTKVAIGSGIWTNYDVTGNVFYDQNNTGYYADPNNWSVFYGLGSYYLRNNYDVSTDHPYGIYFANGLSTAYAIYREPGAWTWPYPDLRIAFHTGISLGANPSYGGVRFYSDYDMSSLVMSVNDAVSGAGANNVYMAGQVGINRTSPNANSKLDVKGITYFGDEGTCSNNNRISAGWYIGCDPIIRPETNWYGYVGTSSLAFYRMYSYGFVTVSRRETKRNITPLDDDLSSYIMDDIDNLKPSFYKNINETDEMESGNETKYRPNMHLGLILDESPDYIQDNAFSGIDVYSLATLGIAGVKYNHKEIKEIKEFLGIGAMITVSDFGSMAMNGTEVFVRFSDDFFSKIFSSDSTLPVITVTPLNVNASLYITEITKEGFKVKNGMINQSPVTFNWIAMAKVNSPDYSEKQKTIPEISSDLLKQLKVPESIKSKANNYFMNLKPTTSGGN